MVRKYLKSMICRLERCYKESVRDYNIIPSILGYQERPRKVNKWFEFIKIEMGGRIWKGSQFKEWQKKGSKELIKQSFEDNRKEIRFIKLPPIGNTQRGPGIKGIRSLIFTRGFALFNTFAAKWLEEGSEPKRGHSHLCRSTNSESGPGNKGSNQLYSAEALIVPTAEAFER